MIKLLKKLLFYQVIAKEGVCNICDKKFPEKTLQEIDGLFLCLPDYHYYENHEWVLDTQGMSDPENPETALNIQNKKDDYAKEGIKSFIKTEYISEGNEIITVFLLYKEKCSTKS